MQKIIPFLWFDGKAYEAAQFYTSIFSNSKITSTIPDPGEKLLTVTFELNGQEFIALNGGPVFSFTEAISFFISCNSQEEIDEKWEKLTADGGKEGVSGWLTDKYGISWQIIPPVVAKMLADPDTARAERVMEAMMQMSRIIIADLERAYEALPDAAAV